MMACRLLTGFGQIFQAVRFSSGITSRKVLQCMPNAALAELSNGFRVASENNFRPTTTIGVWMSAGSRYESDESSGAAYYLDRLLHKGSKKMSLTELENQLSSIGCQLRSIVSRDYTAFFAQCASKDVEKVVGIIADILRNVNVSDAVIESERNSILQDLDDAESNIHDVTFDYIHLTAFQGTTFGRSTLGRSDTIKSMNSKSLQDYINDNFNASRMVLTAVGDVNHDRLVSLAEKYFGDLKNNYTQKTPVGGGVRFTGSQMTYRNDNIPVMHGIIAVEGVPLDHPDAITLHVANKFIGQWDLTHATSTDASTRFLQRVSVQPGLYNLAPFSLNYKDCGLFGFYFVHVGDDISNLRPIVKLLQKEWKYLCYSVSDAEIDRAKNTLKTEIFNNLESNSSRADDIGKQVIYTNKLKTLGQLEQDIESIDKTVMRNTMNEQVYDRDIAAAGVGRTEAFPDYADMRYGMSWWRM